MEQDISHIKALLQNRVVDEVGKLLELKLYDIGFIIMAQSIEVLGAFLDKKPLRAEHQSKKRFSTALFKLFDIKYDKANINDFLYIHFRCNLSHLFTASPHLQLVSSDEAGMLGLVHLQKNGDKVVVVAEVLHQDIIKATNKLFNKMDNNLVKYKKGYF